MAWTIVNREAAWENGMPKLDLKGSSRYGQWGEGGKEGLRPAKVEVAWMYTGAGVGMSRGCWLWLVRFQRWSGQCMGNLAKESGFNPVDNWETLYVSEHGYSVCCFDIFWSTAWEWIGREEAKKGSRIPLLLRRKSPLGTVQSSFMHPRGLTSKPPKTKWLILFFGNTHRH